VSDDEDDTHPNIDTASLFKWRHEARVERMKEAEKEKETLENERTNTQKRLAEIQAKLRESDVSGNVDLSSLKVELYELEKQQAEFKKKEEELSKKEKLAPWNVDTISKAGFSKTVINKPAAKKKEELTDEEREERQRKFTKENEKLLKKFGLLRKYDDSKVFLQEHPHLACEETANYLVLWCISLEVEEKHELSSHVAHQCICMQYVLELGKQLDVDPKACISSFFTRIQLADKQYTDAFDEELQLFKGRVKERAKARIAKAMEEAEEEERQARLGPGGLDPIEVMESLPEVLQKCFESQDIAMLQQAIAQLPEEEARYHMKRCVDSGLWVPEGGKKSNESAEEDVYAEVKLEDVSEAKR